MSGTPSAPEYEPEKWNSQVTESDVEQFYEQNGDIVRRLYADKRNDIPPGQLERIFQSPGDRNMVTLTAPVLLAEALERHHNDSQKVSEIIGVPSAEFPAILERFNTFYQKQGYQDYANCYTYAMNDNDGIYSPDKSLQGDQPGERVKGSGHLAVDDVRRAYPDGNYEAYKRALMQDILADGALPGGMDAERKEGFYRVGVYALPTERLSEGDRINGGTTDMHFVRENRDGTWSHKPGRQGVTDRDSNGQQITDPKTARIGDYDFLGFVYVPEGGLDVGRRGEARTKPGSPEIHREAQTSFPEPLLEDKAEWLKATLASGVVGRVSNEPADLPVQNDPAFKPGRDRPGWMPD